MRNRARSVPRRGEGGGEKTETLRQRVHLLFRWHVYSNVHTHRWPVAAIDPLHRRVPPLRGSLPFKGAIRGVVTAVINAHTNQGAHVVEGAFSLPVYNTNQGI